MKIVYTTQTSDFKDGFAYRNPRYFGGAEIGATQVLVVGDWPDVVAAYEKVGIEVKASKQENHNKTADTGNTDAKPLTIPQIKEALTAKGVEIPAGVTKQADLLALLEAAE